MGVTRALLVAAAASTLLAACGGSSGDVAAPPPVTGIPTSAGASASVTPSVTPTPTGTPHRHHRHRNGGASSSPTATPSAAVTSAAPSPRTSRHRSARPTHSPSPSRRPTHTASPTPAACAPTSRSASLGIEKTADSAQPYRFSSSSVSVSCGGSVVITNHTTAVHTFTPSHGGFRDTGTINANQSRSVRFSYRGSYAFMCTYHPWMTGTVHVS